MSTETFTNTPSGWAELCRKFAIRELNADRAIESAEYSVAGRELLALQAALDAQNAPTVDRQAAIDAAKLDEIRLLLQPILDGCDVALTPREVSVDIMAIVEGE